MTILESIKGIVHPKI